MEGDILKSSWKLATALMVVNLSCSPVYALGFGYYRCAYDYEIRNDTRREIGRIVRTYSYGRDDGLFVSASTSNSTGKVTLVRGATSSVWVEFEDADRTVIYMLDGDTSDWRIDEISQFSTANSAGVLQGFCEFTPY